jgi:hypothetical protein
MTVMFASGLLAQTADPSGPGAPTPIQVAAPVQPIPYSHKKHLALGLKCDFCHTNPASGFYMGFPVSSKCMQCHVEVAKDSPAIRKLAAFDKSKQQVPWVRVYAVPGWVFWNHRTHLRVQVKCETCHGPVAEMDMMRLATNVTTMQGCADCHEAHGAPTGCGTCHENESTQ